jgi:two-component sensor histidine kinase
MNDQERRIQELEDRVKRLEAIVSSLASMTVADECGGGQLRATERNAVLTINSLKQ